MTFYDFVFGELLKRCYKYRETNTQWVLTFTNDVWHEEIRFPKKESRQFNSLYGPAIEALARMMDVNRHYIDYGLAALAQAYDTEEANYHAPFENTKTR